MTPEQIEAIDWAAALAIDDQQHYLDDADPWVDYGDEWGEVAASKAESFTQLAGALRNLGKHETANHALELAKKFTEAWAEAQ